MTKPTYKYPEFVSKVDLNGVKGKRYWLKLEIDKSKTEEIIVILKNPSRANQEISDKTVFNVTNYIERNRAKYSELHEVGRVVILNLIPYYLTDSSLLRDIKPTVIDPENNRIIDEFCGNTKKVIVAWGNHPVGLKPEYESLKNDVMDILEKNQNQVFFVDKLSLAGNPKHGQIWGYKDELRLLNGL